MNEFKWRICRLCLSCGPLVSLEQSLHFKIAACALVQVQEGDGLPPFVCELCQSKICSFYDFKIQCEASELKLKEAFGCNNFYDDSLNVKDEPEDEIGIDIFEQSIKNEGNVVIVDDDDFVPENVARKETSDSVRKMRKKIKKKLKSDSKTISKRRTSSDENLRTRPKNIAKEEIFDNGRKKLKKIKKKLKSDLKTISKRCTSIDEDFHTKPEISLNTLNDLALETNNINSEKQLLSTLESDKEMTKKFQCELCGGVFKWKSVLNKHILTHSSDKAQYACSLCPKRFTRKEYVNVHMRIHAGVKPFICEVCARPFVKRQDLIRHKSIHSDEKNFSCKECAKKFRRAGDVLVHMRTHSRTAQFSCKRCFKRYKSRTGMLKHYNKNQCCEMIPESNVKPMKYVIDAYDEGNKII